MNTPWPDQKKLIVERLLKGKESATQLQTLLEKPLENHGSVSTTELAVQILRRPITDTLSEESVRGPNEICQVVAAEGVDTACSSDRSSKAAAGHRKRPGVEDRRGSYKRRNVSNRWIKVSSIMEFDGYAWRKYGQKETFNAKFPRNYFRCTHKYDQGCLATKQVQCVKLDPPLFQTTYLGRHTCDQPIIQELDPVDSSVLIGFETKVPSKQESLCSAIIPIPKEDLVTSGSSGPAKLMLSKTESAHLEEVVSSVYSCSSGQEFEESDFF